MKPAANNVVPKVQLNATYLDGHVEKTALQTDWAKVRNASGSLTNVYLPTKWK